MTDKRAFAMSPRTQALGAAPTGYDETRMFEEGFSQMAYGAFTAKHPDLIQNVVTLKVLDTDIERGAAVGAFVLQRGQDVVYVPIVMADNQLKPLDMFYHKDLNVFLPLSNAWLDEVDQLTVDELGEATDPPKTLQTGTDIRNLVIPPTTGRYAYASAKTDSTLEEDLVQMLRHLEKAAEVQEGSVLLSFLHKAPNVIKTAFNQTLQAHPLLAAKVAQFHGLDPLCEALKTAKAVDHKGGALHVVTRDDPAGYFKEVFGDDAPRAYQRALRGGYAMKDTRNGTRRAIRIQERTDLEKPNESGFYRVFDQDGKVHHAFVLHNPRKVHSGSDLPEKSRKHHERKKNYRDKDIVILNDGKFLTCSCLVGEKINDEEVKKSDVFAKLLKGKKGDTPTAGSRGLFIQPQGGNYVGTDIVRISSVTTDGQGVRRIKLDGFDAMTLVTDKSAARMGLFAPRKEPVMYIPPDARFIKLNEELYDTFLLQSGRAVQEWVYERLERQNAKKFRIKNAGASQLSVDGRPGESMISAIKTAAEVFQIAGADAEVLVKEAADTNRAVTAYVVSDTFLTEFGELPMFKTAQGPMMDPSSQMQGMPPMDPAMAGGAPPMPPAPPSPLDIAMGEAQTQIQQQMMDLEQQAMALQDKAQTLQTVGMRAQEIAGGGAAAVGAGAPPMPPPGAGAPPTDPAMAGGMGGAPAPTPMGGMSGQDPMMAPSMMQPPIGATMATDAPSAMEIQQQVNPQFLEAAGQLGDAGTFDAAALASMTRDPSFRDMVVDYVPTLERALDNIGRTLLSLWMQESELKDRIGDEEFTSMEDNLRTVFEGLGELIISMNQNATVLSAPTKNPNSM